MQLIRAIAIYIYIFTTYTHFVAVFITDKKVQLSLTAEAIGLLVQE